MQIWEYDGPAQLHFVGEDLDGAVQEGRLVNLNCHLNTNGTCTNNDALPDKRQRPWLGALVEDAPLVSSLWEELKKDARIDLLDGVLINSIKAPSPSSMGNVEPPPPVHLSFTRTIQGSEEESALSANLLVASDGAHSPVRRAIGSFPMVTRAYGRRAVTCTVELDSDMAHTAFQRFVPHGPIALLPVWNSREGVNASEDEGIEKSPVYANVVWSTTPSMAEFLLSLSPSEFAATLNQHLRHGPHTNPSLLPILNQGMLPFVPLASTIAKELDSLLRTANTAFTMGTWTESPSRNYFRMPPKTVGVVSPILGFDLSCSHVVRSGSRSGVGGYSSPRVALVGDAAHTMHPMAGQGLNLGMGDAHSLANLIKEATDAGMDVGGTSLFLDRYNDERFLKGLGMVGGVHGLHEIFGCSRDIPGSIMGGTYEDGMGSARGVQGLIAYSRSLGMNVVNGLPMIRRALAEVAAGATPKGFG